MKQNNSHITCPSCARAIVPRLWHFNQFGITRVQHLCPFCGKVLYVTGPPWLLVVPLQVLHVFFKIVMMIAKGASGRFN